MKLLSLSLLPLLGVVSADQPFADHAHTLEDIDIDNNNNNNNEGYNNKNANNNIDNIDNKVDGNGDTKKKNVLYILADDMRADWGSYGLPVHTPNLDKLVGEGLRFTHAFCQISVCSPSRQSFMT